MKKILLCLALLTVCLPFVPQPAQAKTNNWKIRRIEFIPVKCDRKDCWAWHQSGDNKKWNESSPVKHGNLRIVYRSGKSVVVTKDAAVAGNEPNNGEGATSDAQIGPDHLTVGWTQGFHHPCVDWSIGGTMFINPNLVLYRKGKILRVIKVPGTFINSWRFWNDGKYVAIGSRWHHGVGYVRLFDIASGKLLQRMTTPEAEEKKLKWAKGLTW